MSEEKQIILPYGFERVKFLEDDGVAWIDTSYIPNNETGLYVDAQQLIHGSTVPLGCRKDNNDTRFYVGHWLKSTGNTSGYGWGTWTSWGNNGNGSRFEGYTNFYNERVAKLAINGVIKYKNNLGILSFTPSVPICLFNVYASKTDGNQWKGRIYEAKITQDNELIRHFIPAYDTIREEGCMYDLVSQEAFYNQGSGRFLTDRDYAWHYPLLNNNYNLPYGFKKCVYLQSDGTQWIDTGVAPNNETGLFCKTIKFDNAFGSFFGVRDTSNSSIMSPFMGKNGKSLSYRWKSTSVNDIIIADNAGDYSFSSFLNYYNDRLAKFDSEDTDFVESISGILENYTHNIWLFSTNFQGSFNTDYGKYRGRICRAQITQGDTLIRDFIPCLDGDGRPCMWDSINDVAYYNQSGGTEFTYCVEHQLPSDFLKLKYLESTGTQYIKTGYVPTNTTGLYIDTQVIGSGDTIPMGLRESSSTNTRFFITRQTSTSNVGYGWGTWTEISTSKGSVRYDSTLNWLNDRKSITNNPLFATAIKNLGELPFTPSLDIWMFGINQGGSHAYKFKGRIYRAKISEGSEVVRDFVPAFDTEQQRPCMYDLINAQAFYNEGTGEFDYFPRETNYTGFCQLGVIGNRLGTGEDGLPYGYTRLNYLQSSGTQYIEIDEPFYLNADEPSCGAKLKIHLHTRNLFNPLWGVQPFNSPVVGNTSMYIGRGSDYRFGVLIYAKTSVQYDELNTIWEGEYNYLNSNLMRVTLADGQSKQGDYMLKTWKGSAESPKQLLFGMYDSSTGDISKGIGRIYEAQFTNGTKITRYLIPCLDFNGRPCMFDKVSRKTFYNKGTGEFLYGYL